MYFDQVEFGKRICELRRIHRKSQEALASELNVSSDHIKKMEMGIRACSIDLLVELSTYFSPFSILFKELGLHNFFRKKSKQPRS